MAAFSGIPLTIDSSTLNTSTPQDVTVLFQPPLILGSDEYELGLIKVMLWYAWYNISPQYNNTTLRYSPDAGVTWKTITIISGQYSIDELNSRIQSLIVANGDVGTNVSIVADFSTLKIQIVLLGGYQVDLTQGNLYNLLGFTPIIVTSTQLGANPANINNDINSLKITCDILTGSYDNNVSSNTLYVFSPNSGPGTQINITVNPPLFIPVRNTRTINSIRITLVDNLNRTINLNGQPVTYLLYLRPRK